MSRFTDAWELDAPCENNECVHRVNCHLSKSADDETMKSTKDWFHPEVFMDGTKFMYGKVIATFECRSFVNESKILSEHMICVRRLLSGIQQWKESS